MNGTAAGRRDGLSGVGRLACLFALGCLAPACTSVKVPEMDVAGRAQDAPVAVKITLGAPGVYAVDLEVIESLGLPLRGLPSSALRLTGRGHELTAWVDENGDRRQLRFLADQALFRPDGLRDAAPLRVLELSIRPERAFAASGPTGPTGATPTRRSWDGPVEELPAARLERRVVLEDDRIRASVPMGNEDDVETLWYWAMLSNLTSSALEVDLAVHDDLAPEGPGPRLALHVLGWSRTNVPDGMAQHRLDVALGSAALASASWDGRVPRVLEFEIPRARVVDEESRLRITIPSRTPPGADEPLVDVSYVDRLEVRYRPRSPLAHADAPLLLAPSSAPSFLADPAGSPGSFLVSSAGWTLPRNQDGGWVLPPTQPLEAGKGEAGELELWVADDDTLRTPLAVEASRRGGLEVADDLDYLIVAPPGLVPGSEALARIHRARGLRVGVVDVEAIYDQFGGEPRAEHLRTFLHQQADRGEALRFVLLVGEADWFESDDLEPLSSRSPAERHRIPLWTYLSRYGMGASDHYYTVPLDVDDPRDEASPRFAIGRLPVDQPETLAAYVEKVERWLAARSLDTESLGTGSLGTGSLGTGSLETGSPEKGSPDKTAPTAVFLSDASPGSQLRQERLLKRLEELPLAVETPLADLAGNSPDEAVIEALAASPDLVYFGGHGSRHTFQLGDPASPSPETFFDREDVARLAPSDRLPLVLAISCATAPFDHPQVDSLGEVMLLSAERGAVAFVGASAALFTPRALADGWVRSWLEEETVGEAFAAAKRRAGSAHASHLYSLLGDPALPAQGPERGAHE